jgi:leader peptidase (prepilin peptidase) / N-methyltransferase
MTGAAARIAPHTPGTWLLGSAAAGASVGLALGIARGDAGSAISLALFIAVLAVMSAIDVRERRIPNALTYPGVVIALGVAAASGAGIDAVGGMLIAGGAMGFFWLVGRGALGLGDVKLSAFAGAALGMQGAVTFLVVGALVGAGAALVVLAMTRNRRATLPYGPWLAIGATIAAVAHGLAAY